MSQIPREFIQTILNQIDIVEFISTRIHLKQAGDSAKACCPFHHEKSPSFTVSRRKQFYYCFGCGAGGDVIKFVMAYDHLDFRSAIEFFADHLNLPMPTEVVVDTRTSKVGYALLDRAMRFFCHQLRQSPEVHQYCRDRGLDGEVAKRFALGHCPSDGAALFQFLKPGVDVELMKATGLGLASQPRQSYFKGPRLIFPIRDVRGRAIGFGARALANIQPKYINSSENDYFHKGFEVYGLYEALQASASTLDSLIVVEGYMDVIALSQYGLTNAVACLGTAVTSGQIKKLLRYSKRLYFAFDGDRAGQKAAWKALNEAWPFMRSGIHLHFVFLPEGEDPDSIIREHGPSVFRQYLDDGLDLMAYFTQVMRERYWGESLSAQAEFWQHVKEYVDQLQPGIFRDMVLRSLEDRYGAQGYDASMLLAAESEGPPDCEPSFEPGFEPGFEPDCEPVYRDGDQKKSLPKAFGHMLTMIMHQPCLLRRLSSSDVELLSSVPGGEVLNRLFVLVSESEVLSCAQLLRLLSSEEASRLQAYITADPLLADMTDDMLNDAFSDSVKLLKNNVLTDLIASLVKASRNKGLTQQAKADLTALLALKQTLADD